MIIGIIIHGTAAVDIRATGQKTAAESIMESAPIKTVSELKCA